MWKVLKILLSLWFMLVWIEFELRRSAKRAVCFIALFLFAMTAVWSRSYLADGEPTAIALTASCALATYIHVCCASFGMLVLDVAFKIYRKWFQRPDSNSCKSVGPRFRLTVEARKIKLALGYGYFILLSVQGFYVAFSKPQIVRVTMNFDSRADGISPLFDGYRIVQLSDVHLGRVIGSSRFTEVILEVNKLNPNILVITGDLMDAPRDYLKDALQPLRQLKMPVYHITGNHEFYYDGLDESLRQLRELGVHTLVNDGVVLHGSRSRQSASAILCLSGMHDLSAGQLTNFTAALSSCPANSAVVLLVHQPYGAHLVLDAPSEDKVAALFGIAQTSLAERRRRVKLVLSGHLHAGQIAPYSFVYHLLQLAFVSPYYNGLYKLVDSSSAACTYVYVSAGTFFGSLPMRTGSWMEITELTFRIS